MQIRRLKVENWKNFRSVECRFAQRAFFIGPNASGKSNLLDALRFLRDICAAEGGGLQAAVSARGGLSTIRCLAARHQPDIRFEIDFQDKEGTQWRYTLVFGGAQKKGDTRVRVREEHVAVGNEPEPRLARPTEDDRSDDERLTETALEQTSANRSFRDIAVFLRTLRYLHVVPQIIRDPARAADHSEDPFGGDLLRRINETAPKRREHRLDRLREALTVAVPQMKELHLEVDKSGTPHLKAKYEHWRPQGAWQREEQFSDGTLRLLGLIWALQEKEGPLLLEEPELSLNPTVIRSLPRLMARATKGSKRQTFITTHSYDLLAGEGIGLDEVFLLEPARNGTAIIAAAEIDEVRDMVAAGMPLSDALLPRTQPPDPGALERVELV
ncbi:MAG: AAA family ATPase [Alphaproteobacteria bacterium]|nr:AAA family ATPase [Alphaproteobacteria bacterium]